MVEAERLSRSLHAFIREGWKQIPKHRNTEFADNWHIGVVCAHLEAMHHGKIRKLLINQPPRTTKSMCVAVFFPAWVWAQDPTVTFLCVSYSEKLSEEHSVSMRDLVLSDWYQSRWPMSIREDQNTKMRFDNTHGGRRIASTIGGVGTGLGGNYVILDDPNHTQKAESEADREQVLGWVRGTMPMRIDGPPDKFRRIIDQQRVHAYDASGWVLENDSGWEHVCLPMRFDGVRRSTVLGTYDPRTEEGELLNPEHFPEEEVAGLEQIMQDLAPGQLQQQPTTTANAVFRADWFKERRYSSLPDHVDEMVQSWDMAFKGTDSSSFVVGQVWARVGAQFFLVDQIRQHLSFTETIQALLQMCARYPRADPIYVEDKANGPAVIDELKSKVPGLVAVEPEGDKVARARAVSGYAQQGAVWIPAGDRFPSSTGKKDLVADWLKEITTFPKAAHDDQVDAMSQALRKLAYNARMGLGVAPIQTGETESHDEVVPEMTAIRTRRPGGGLRGMRRFGQ